MREVETFKTLSFSEEGEGVGFSDSKHSGNSATWPGEEEEEDVAGRGPGRRRGRRWGGKTGRSWLGSDLEETSLAGGQVPRGKGLPPVQSPKGRPHSNSVPHRCRHSRCKCWMAGDA